MKKYIAELIGTAALVTIGCGTAMLVGCDASSGSGYVLTAFAFGLVIVAMAYSIGNISGCHINPAVSLGCLLAGRMEAVDFFPYVIAQCIGSFVGTLILAVIFLIGDVQDMTGSFGANGLVGVGGSFIAGLVVEIILTFIFVLTVLGATDSKYKNGRLAGLVIGFALVLVHILGIGLTGTSVNPARSIAPAVFAAFTGNFGPIISLWVFVVGPFVGAVLAAICYNFLTEK